jgi:predicted metalloendopeptidase
VQSHYAEHIRSLTFAFNKKMDWMGLIVKGLMKNCTTSDISDSEPLIVYDWNYIVNAARMYSLLLNNESKRRDFFNLMGWAFMEDKTCYLSKKFNRDKLEFDNARTGIMTLLPRALICAQDTAQRMPQAVGRLYIEKHFDNSTKQAVI